MIKKPGTGSIIGHAEHAGGVNHPKIITVPIVQGEVPARISGHVKCVGTGGKIRGIGIPRYPHSSLWVHGHGFHSFLKTAPDIACPF